jgi:nitrile hydratase
MDGVHDMGGMHGFGAIDIDAIEPSHSPLGTRAQIIAMLSRGVTRAVLEAQDPAAYLRSHYHDRWLTCAEDHLVDQGVVSDDQLDRWREAFEHDSSAVPPRQTADHGVEGLVARLMTTPLLHPSVGSELSVGDRVRVRRMAPIGHHRCPRYIRGVAGMIERVLGSDVLPGEAEDSEREDYFTIRFESVDLWGDRAAEGEPAYDLYIDLCESYLEPA